MRRSHSMPFGAELREDGSVWFRLWAPKARSVDVCFESPHAKRSPLVKLEDGWFEVVTHDAAVGTRYRFRIDDEIEVPDPASRYQPADVHGPSEVIDPRAFDWDDGEWRGRPWEDAVIYELHVGAFTPEGTFQGAEKKLDYLRDLGVTAIELMPVADFPGCRNWGYDGVLPFAPDSSYGRPDDLKHLVQAAHARGLMVFLDVVYNHFGPDGNYLSVYSPQFFTDRHHTPWGEAINFDGPKSRVVRDFFIHNALYWLEEYHFDGLRFDAVHAILDDSQPDILTELAQAVRQRFDGRRLVHLILENADNVCQYLQRGSGGRVQLYNAQWNDDIHHAMHVLITGESDGYYSDYLPEPLRHLCRCLAEGFAYQGQYSEFHGSPRGEPSHSLPPSAFISFLQNHDQVGNRALGERISQLAPPAAVKAAMEILLLAPSPPLLFMGEEFAAATPFLFFCDFHGELAAAVTNGRRNEFGRFAKFSSLETRETIPNPNAEETYLRSKLDWPSVDREPHAGWLRLYKNLLSIRQRKLVPYLQHSSKASVQACSEQNRLISIDWTFHDGALLQLRANVGLSPISSQESLLEGMIYCSSQAAEDALRADNLPAWSVVWRLQD